MNFDLLVHTIHDTHTTLQQSAIKAINKHLTIRNWLIGFYIVEFEQKGEDRARYGEKLLQNLADSLNQNSLSYRNLRLFRQFYLLYPQISETIKEQFSQLNLLFNRFRDLGIQQISETIKEQFSQLNLQSLNWQSPIAKSLSVEKQSDINWQSIANLKNVPGNAYEISPDKLLAKLSYTHLVQLFPINDPLKRTFYESACIKGNWSVSELKRQINTLYFERSGMSLNPEKLSLDVQENVEKVRAADIIKSPFTFEFLGLKSRDTVYENELEQALVDHLEEFLIELGHGFCFESKQKRITIGDEYFFIDLVFYHRILKCHVLVELKTNEVKHEHIGQLKTYINYYKKEIMLEGDNPPVGILLVTDQNKALVEYAVADNDMALFVSKYILELPSKEQLEVFIKSELNQL